MKIKVIILGAAGRDFHNFNTFYRDNEAYEVVGFTTAQIPDIDERIYPPELAGKLYPNGIKIYPEEELPKLIKKYGIDEVILAYSDLSYDYVMRRSAIVNAAGADFKLMGPKRTTIKSKKPVIAICAVRTGCGKSQISRRIFKILREMDYRVVAIRHPMPYDKDLTKQICQRFASYEDLNKYSCTIEEREEYEPYIDMGGVVYSGIDYEKILREAEKEADIIIWDGGNNDIPFIKPNLHIVVTDPHRPGNEISYYPGEVNLRMADIVIINKVDTANERNVEIVRRNVRNANPQATIIKSTSPISVDEPEFIKDKKAIIVEDGPTVTHGGMKYGAGKIAAERNGAIIINPRPYAVGSIIDVFKKYGHLANANILPAMGYGEKQIKELESTINRAQCDIVISGTPIDLERILKVNKPIIRARYEIGDKAAKELEKILIDFCKKL
jgi:predicted GTPase